MEKIKVIRLNETTSTNTFLAGYKGDEGELLTVVTAERQTAGRGQGSNTWESEEEKNLLFSIRAYPENLSASRQFVMLEAGALAIRDALAEIIGEVTIKWPNDIYWRDRKISGTLSECGIKSGRVGCCILGTGININQQIFTGDAPNPVSLRNILGCDADREQILDRCLHHFQRYLKMVNAGRYDETDRMYAEAMYRRRGVYEYEDKDGRFTGEILRIEPDGHIVIKHDNGKVSKYAFKEVRFIINGR